MCPAELRWLWRLQHHAGAVKDIHSIVWNLSNSSPAYTKTHIYTNKQAHAHICVNVEPRSLIRQQAGSPSTICIEQFLFQKTTEFLAVQGGQGKSGALATMKVGMRAMIGQFDAGLKLRAAKLRWKEKLLRRWAGARWGSERFNR